MKTFIITKLSGKELVFKYEEPVDPAAVQNIDIYDEHDFRYRLYRKYASKPNSLYFKGTFNSYDEMYAWAEKQK